MKIAHGTLVMVMDGRKMLLLRNKGDVQKPILQTIVEETAENPRTGLQGTDRPGRAFSRATTRRSALAETDWHEEAKTRFTRDALKTLGKVQKKEDNGVIVLAAPSVLGDFRKHCSGRMKDCIIAEIDKDVVNHVPQDIVKVISAYEQ